VLGAIINTGTLGGFLKPPAMRPAGLSPSVPDAIDTGRTVHHMADVVYFITDMLFSSKLREAAKATGVTVQPAREPAAFAAAAREAKLAIVDLRLPAALAALDALGETIRQLRVVGFIDHEKTDVMDAARAKGCSDVMAKGQFANALPKLLAAIVASSSSL
jgi:DNA-binding NarL/FixJ family response regulator